MQSPREIKGHLNSKNKRMTLWENSACEGGVTEAGLEKSKLFDTALIRCDRGGDDHRADDETSKSG